MNILLTIIAAVFVFSILIFIHELGHFITAKASGIQVNEFALGMGPKLLSFGSGETVYSLRLFPIGGFCAMEGEDEESRNPRAFGNAAIWKRATVLVAGSAMNLLLGLLVLTWFSSQLNLIGTTQVARFAENAVTNQVLQPGDIITRIGGKRVRTSNDLQYRLMRDRDGIVEMEVERGGRLIPLTVTFTMVEADEDIFLPVLDFMVVGVEKTPARVIANAFDWTSMYIKQVWGSLVDLLTGRFSLAQLSGPVGVTSVIGEAASSGYAAGYQQGGFWEGFRQSLQSILHLMSFITVNLGVFNLLPFPALDGGRLLFLAIEAVRRKPVPVKYESFVTAAGFVLLIGLIVVVTFNDIVKLVSSFWGG